MMGGRVKNASLVYATHRIGPRNKLAAIATAAAVHSAGLMIASHNHKVARSIQ